ncbi:hypothetical protein [Hymenobacter properus]|uniref:Uncharacterized protein n=1 Tax=Hymenobacter properus TaxID=2791026 RepID=A0A931FMU4_9BACT|nr:hypothetical protein [Hymenobacter properus]MBF9143446.1 hypothetical protein [Hymenobacter properus]MBR7722259.1 hypothetical protein [Microvirga sp. SRT04]
MAPIRHSWSLHQPWPVLRCVLLVLALYAVYLPLSGYSVLPWDAEQYWQLVSRFFINKKDFSILNYDANLRGYIGPLLIVPVRAVCMVMGWAPLHGSQFIGVLWAALLFGFTLPAFWKCVTGHALMAKQWLLLVGLSFVLWGDYFNFCIQDFPAFTALLLALIALAQPGWRWAGVGGLLLAMALNMRPIYLASLPGALGWFWWQQRRFVAGVGPKTGVGGTALSLLALVAGAALLLFPQVLINYRHFGHLSPLVLATDNGHMSFYLKQLNWGTAFQRYDSSIDPSHYGGVLYADRAGTQLLAAQAKGYFESYQALLGYYLRHPLEGIGHYLHHTFNGLDLWYATPYPMKVAKGGPTLVQLFNYVVLALGLGYALVALKRVALKRAAVQPRAFLYNIGWALLAAMLPVCVAIPTAVECRFLLPLHLLLISLIAVQFRPRQLLRLGPTKSILAVLAIAITVWGGTALSADTKQQVLPAGTQPPGY